jgi:hypothetical protein
MGARKRTGKSEFGELLSCNKSWAFFELPRPPAVVMCRAESSARARAGRVGRTSAGHYYSRRRSYWVQYAVWVEWRWCAEQIL